MIWLAWRQFRVQATVCAAALAAFAITFAATGPHLAGLYDASGIAACHVHRDCGALASNFLSQLNVDRLYPTVYLLGIFGVLTAPGIIGVFWGAPLIAREIEAGTYRLAWTQSITRTRWLAVKLGLIGAAAMAATELLSLLQAWWAAPIGRAAGMAGASSLLGMNRFGTLVFATHGITPLGYAAFAFTLGVTAGLLTRRAIPAMAVTLVVFTALQVAMALGIRSHLLPAQHAVVPLSTVSTSALGSSERKLLLTVNQVNGLPGAWIVSSGPVDTAGHPVTTTPSACESARDNYLTCLAGHGVRAGITYQPVGRYWTLQGIETAMFLALAAALAWFCFRQTGRRDLA